MGKFNFFFFFLFIYLFVGPNTKDFINPMLVLVITICNILLYKSKYNI